MRERLRIGEVAKLVGVTPKTVRHYEKVGLLKKPERSESGYRLYSADDLLRLHRVKKLQSLGLSLRRVGDVLGEADQERSLRDILKTLRAEVDAEIVQMDLLGEHLAAVDEKALEQERKFWSMLDAFEWPAGYDKDNEKMFRYYAEHPEEYRELVAIGERLAALADLPEDDPKVEEVAEGLVAHFERYPTPEDLETSSWAAEGPFGQAMLDVTVSTMSPAQRRVMALLVEEAEEKEGGDA